MSWQTVRDHIPDGRVIDDEQFEIRHRIISIVLIAHAPVLTIIGLLNDFALWHTLLEVSPVLVLAGFGLGPLHRLPRSIASCRSPRELMGASPRIQP